LAISGLESVQDPVTYHRNIAACLILLQNCIISYDAPKEMVAEVISWLNRFYDEFDSIPLNCYSILGIGRLAYFRSELFLPFVDDCAVTRLMSAVRVDDERLSCHALRALDNIAFKCTELAMTFVMRGIFEFEMPEIWSPKSFLHFCRLLQTILLRTSQYKVDHNDDFCGQVVSRIRDRAQILVAVLVEQCENAQFAVREGVAHVICNLVNLNDAEMLHLIMNGNAHIIEYLCEILHVRNDALASSILTGLIRLCDFGDRIAIMITETVPREEITENPNPFLAAAVEAELEATLEDVLEIYGDSQDISDQVTALRKAIQRGLEFQDIDFGQPEEFELNI
jgi:hypothetical protein